MFIGYVDHTTTAYRFFIMKNEVIDCNIVIETNNAKFFENIFSLFEKIFHSRRLQITLKTGFNKK